MVRAWSKKVAVHRSRQVCEVSIAESDLRNIGPGGDRLLQFEII